MRKFAPGIKIAIGLFAAAIIVVAIASLVPRGPMHHGWDWPWHDWWHSQTGSAVGLSGSVGR